MKKEEKDSMKECIEEDFTESELDSAAEEITSRNIIKKEQKIMKEPKKVNNTSCKLIRELVPYKQKSLDTETIEDAKYESSESDVDLREPKRYKPSEPQKGRTWTKFSAKYKYSLFRAD